MLTTAVACIKDFGYASGSEELFKVYSACSNIEKSDKLTQYHVVPNRGDCFLKQYPFLSELVATRCIPEEFNPSFLNCMDEENKNFLSSLKKVTLFFDGNTLGVAFEKRLNNCALKAISRDEQIEL